MRQPHQNVATVLVDPARLRDLELDLMARDLWVWPVATASASGDGPRQAFQVRRRMVESRRGAWDLAMAWTPVWISFGDSWHHGADPLPWAAHAALWDTLARHGEHVRFRKALGGIAKLALPQEHA